MDENQSIHMINIDNIIPNRFQPRLTFDEQALNELSASIKEHGIIQPLVLRKVDDKYEIVAGERRYKAATLAGLTEVPAIIVNFDDNKSAEVALIENVQRRNLTSIEEAKSYKKILDKKYLTQEDLAKKLGVSQSTIANKLRLLNLSPNVQEALLNEKISERHARSLLQMPNHAEQDLMLNRVIQERMTVRQLDNAIKEKYGAQNEESSEENIKVPNFTEVNFDMSQPQNIFEPQNIENTTPEEPKVETLEILPDDIQPVNEVEQLQPKNTISKLLNIFDKPEYPSLEDQQVNLSFDNSSSNIFDTSEDEEVKEVEKIPEVNNVTPEPIIQEVKVEEPKPKIKENDLNSVITSYKELEQEVKDAGYKITSEEFDFEDLYQIIIKIDKQAE